MNYMKKSRVIKRIGLINNMNFKLIKKHKDILYKFGIYLYMIALTFIIISNASKAFNKLIWPNERYVVVIIASLFFLLFFLAFF